MAVSWFAAGGGLTGDINTEVNTCIGASAATLSGGVITLPLNVNGNACIACYSIWNRTIGDATVLGTDGNMLVIPFEFGLSAAPSGSVEVGMVSHKGDSGARYLRVDSGQHLQHYDAGGAARGPLLNSDTIPTGGARDMIYACFWRYNGTIWLGTLWSGAWALQFTDTTIAWNTFFDSTHSLVIGEDMPAGVNRGVTATVVPYPAFVLTSGSYPWEVGLPQLLVAGGTSIMPKAAGTNQTWAPSTGSDHDDLVRDGGGPNDGDSSYVDGIFTSPAGDKEENFKYTDANPLSGTPTIDVVCQGSVGRQASGGKAYAKPWFRSGSNTAGPDFTAIFNQQQPGTSHTGMLYPMERPGGGAFSKSDFDLSGGSSTLEIGMMCSNVATPDYGARCTYVPGPIIFHHTATHTLADNPIPAGGRRRGTIVGMYARRPRGKPETVRAPRGYERYGKLYLPARAAA